GGLDRLRASQKRAGRQAGFDRDAEIDEGRLVFDPPRRRAVVRGAGEKAHVFAVAKRGDRAIERVAHVSNVAAERDERFSHGLVSPGLVSPGLVSPGLVSPGLVSPGLVSLGLVSLGLGGRVRW